VTTPKVEKLVEIRKKEANFKKGLEAVQKAVVEDLGRIVSGSPMWLKLLRGIPFVNVIVAIAELLAHVFKGYEY